MINVFIFTAPEKMKNNISHKMRSEISWGSPKSPQEETYSFNSYGKKGVTRKGSKG